MSKRILLIMAIGCLSTSNTFSQPSLFTSSTNPQKQSTGNDITPPTSPDDFKKSVNKLAQKNMDSLNEQLKDMLSKKPPPSLPPPPKISGQSGQNAPPPSPESIQVPTENAGSPAEQKTGTPQPPTKTPQQALPPIPSSEPTESTAPSSGGSSQSTSQTYTGFGAPPVNKNTPKPPASGGFNIKY